MAGFSEKVGLFRGLLNGEAAGAGPFYVTVDVTRRCNLQCLGCPAHSPHATRPRPGDPTVQDIPLDLFESVCRQLEAMNTDELIFSGEGNLSCIPRSSI